MNKRAVYRIVMTGLALALLSACGNKGPLVLPDKPDAASAPATAPAPAPAADAQPDSQP